MTMQSPGDDNAFVDVASGDYELHRKIRDGDIVLDLGAHVGFFTQLASAKVGSSGQVIAFEPNPRNYAELTARMAGRQNCIHYPVAAFNRNSQCPLWRNSGNTGGHSLWRNEQHDAFDLVPAVNIGAFVLGMEATPDFIKIDTEGAEWKIVSSLLFHAGSKLLSKPTHIALEVHTEALAVDLQATFGSDWNFRPKSSIVGIWFADGRAR